MYLVESCTSILFYAFHAHVSPIFGVCCSSRAQHTASRIGAREREVPVATACNISNGSSAGVSIFLTSKFFPCTA